LGGSSSRKALIFRIAEAGEIIGLPTTLSAKPYAETVEPTQAIFIGREDFLTFLREHGEATLQVAEMLSNIYYATGQEVRYLGLSNTAAEKLARFLLDLKPTKNSEPRQIRTKLIPALAKRPTGCTMPPVGFCRQPPYLGWQL
jgi:CRP-like cAMP-binding protein